MLKLLLYSAILLLFITLTFGCNRIKTKSEELADKSLNKAKEAWKETVEGVFDAFTTSKNSSFQTVFGTRDSLHVQEVEGIHIDLPAGFYFDFLKYEADKKTILSYIKSLPEDPIENEMASSDAENVDANLELIKRQSPQIYAKLGFFTAFKQEKDPEFYSCTKRGVEHNLIFVKNSKTVYHFMENNRD